MQYFLWVNKYTLSTLKVHVLLSELQQFIYFSKVMYTFIHQGNSELIKSAVKTFTLLQNISVSNKWNTTISPHEYSISHHEYSEKLNSLLAWHWNCVFHIKGSSERLGGFVRRHSSEAWRGRLDTGRWQAGIRLKIRAIWMSSELRNSALTAMKQLTSLQRGKGAHGHTRSLLTHSKEKSPTDIQSLREDYTQGWWSAWTYTLRSLKFTSWARYDRPSYIVNIDATKGLLGTARTGQNLQPWIYSKYWMASSSLLLITS